MADLFLVPYVRAVWRELGLRLGSSGRMALFGAGAHTRWLLGVTADLPALPITCMLDDDPKDAKYLGLPVRRPDEVDTGEITLVLLSSDQWEAQLAARASELWGPSVEIVRLYQNLPLGPYDKSDHRTSALNCLRKLDVRRPLTPRQVVLISDLPRGREAKIGYALKSAGWHPVLLHGNTPDFDGKRHFDETRSYSNSYDALRLACEYSPVAYHVLVNTDYRTAETLLRHRPGYVVVDSYDLVADMYSSEFLAARPALNTQLERERLCLEEADGVCARSHEYDYLARRHGYRYRRKLSFPDGCWNQSASQEPLHDGVHVVYAGGITLEGCAGDEFATHGHRLWLARALAEQEVHFHLYPIAAGEAEPFEKTYHAFLALGEATGFVHVYQPVPVDRVGAELSRYHFGIFVYNHLSGLPGTPCPNTEAKLDNCTSNKFYDYLDADLPVIHNAAPSALLSRIVERQGVGISVRDVPGARWGEVLRSLDLGQLRCEAAQARADYDVRRRAPELTAFYESVRVDVPGRLGTGALPEGDRDYANGREEHRSALV